MASLSLTKQFNYNKSHNQTYKERVVLSKGQINVIKGHMNDLSFQRKNGESKLGHFRRFYKYLNLDFADEIDFDKSGVK